MRALVGLVLLGWIGSTAGGAATYEAPLAERETPDAKLTAGPTAKRAEGGVEITFAVSKPTDGEVAILGAKGGVVRHLAAGLIGEHAPPPLRKGTLKQALLWDGKDDAGQDVLGEKKGGGSRSVSGSGRRRSSRRPWATTGTGWTGPAGCASAPRENCTS